MQTKTAVRPEAMPADKMAALERIYSRLSPEQKLGAMKDARRTAVLWQPNPDHEDGTANPQRLVYESTADVIGLSGTARWGKTDIFFGFAANKHKHSVMFRRKFKSLRSTIERSREVFNPHNDESRRDSYNEQLHRWIIDDRKRIVEFDAIQYEHNKEDQRGKPRDLIWFDEATEFTMSVIDFVSAWNFSADKSQKCRTILAFNVPATNDGEWVIQYFLPWIAYLFPHKFEHYKPAKPGELRWYATIDGKEIECKSGDPFGMTKQVKRCSRFPEHFSLVN